MRLLETVEYTPDPGRRLSEEERAQLVHLYPWPRPKSVFCKLEKDNDRWRLGRC